MNGDESSENACENASALALVSSRVDCCVYYYWPTARPGEEGAPLPGGGYS